MKGSNYPAVNASDIEETTLLLPPLPEQQKIAEILSSVDYSIALTQAVIAQTRKVKQALLQQLLTRGIGHTKFKGTAIGRIPESWKIKPLETVAYIQTGIAKGKKDIIDPVELPYLRVANVQDGYLDLSEIKTILASRKDINRYLVKPNDILLTEGGDFDKLGRGDIWRGQIEPCLHQNHVFVVRADSRVLLPEFLAVQTGSNYGKQCFLSCAKQTTNLASINSTQLREFPALIPSLNEQRLIVEILDSVRIEELAEKREYESLQKLKNGFMQDLLTGHVRVMDVA